MEKLFKGENYLTDVTIEFAINDLKIILSLHRIILARKSDYFKKLFINDFKSETKHVITLDHTNPYALLDTLNEIYGIETNSGDVPDYQRELEMMVLKDYFLIPFDGKKLLSCDIPSDGYCLLERTSEMIDNMYLKILCHKYDIKTDMPNLMIVAIYDNKYLNTYWAYNNELILINSRDSYHVFLRGKYYSNSCGKMELRHLITDELKIKSSRRFEIFSESGASFAYVVGRGKIRIFKGKSSNIVGLIQNIHYTQDGKYLICDASDGVHVYDTKNYDLIDKHNVYDDYGDDDFHEGEFEDIIVLADNLIGYAVGNKLNFVKLPFFNLARTIHIDDIEYFCHVCYSCKESYLILIGDQKIYVYDKNHNRISSFLSPIKELEYVYCHPIDESKIIILSDQLYQMDIFTKEITSFKNVTLAPGSTISVFKFT